MRAAATGAAGATLLVLLGLAPCAVARDDASADRWATKWISILSAHESFAEAQAGRFSPWAPTAYVRKSKLHMGCLL